MKTIPVMSTIFNHLGYISKTEALNLVKYIVFDLCGTCKLSLYELIVPERHEKEVQEWLIQNELRKEVEK